MENNDPKRVQELIAWLKKQVKTSTQIIEDAHQHCNYGKETQYMGMREAFLKMLNKLNSHQNLVN